MAKIDEGSTYFVDAGQTLALIVAYYGGGAFVFVRTIYVLHMYVYICIYVSTLVLEYVLIRLIPCTSTSALE